LGALGEIRKKIEAYEYIVNFCDTIQNIPGCEGAHVCQVKDGKGKSMGSSPLSTVKETALFTNGTVGCGGKARKTQIQFDCQKEVTIASVNEALRCEYEIVIGQTNCDAVAPACQVKLIKQLGGHKCSLGKSFGCFEDKMWAETCKGTFECNGKKVNCVAALGEKVECNC